MRLDRGAAFTRDPIYEEQICFRQTLESLDIGDDGRGASESDAETISASGRKVLASSHLGSGDR